MIALLLLWNYFHLHADFLLGFQIFDLSKEVFMGGNVAFIGEHDFVCVWVCVYGWMGVRLCVCV